MLVYDLTMAITVDAKRYPGDPPFRIEQVKSLARGDRYNLCCISMGNHMGTHIDFPSHVIENGKNSADFPIDTLVGKGVILECAEERLTRSFIQANHKIIAKTPFIFLKTSSRKKHFFIEKNAAEELVRQQIKILGVDRPSVDSCELEDLPIHRILLSNNILIIENLNLQHISAGEGEIIIAPLHIPNADGLPARVLIRR